MGYCTCNDKQWLIEEGLQMLKASVTDMEEAYRGTQSLSERGNI